jgi:hypothetical protein
VASFRPTGYQETPVAFDDGADDVADVDGGHNDSSVRVQKKSRPSY